MWLSSGATWADGLGAPRIDSGQAPMRIHHTDDHGPTLRFCCGDRNGGYESGDRSHGAPQDGLPHRAGGRAVGREGRGRGRNRLATRASVPFIEPDGGAIGDFAAATKPPADATRKFAEATEKSARATEKTAEATEKSPEATEKTPQVTEKTPETTQKTPRATQKTALLPQMTRFAGERASSRPGRRMFSLVCTPLLRAYAPSWVTQPRVSVARGVFSVASRPFSGHFGPFGADLRGLAAKLRGLVRKPRVVWGTRTVRAAEVLYLSDPETRPLNV